MAEQPLLSIVITSYTMERYQDATGLLDSIKIQTLPDIEIILIVERSFELLDKLKRYVRDINIHNTKIVFNDGEHGLSNARNMGIKESRGAYIAFVDDDAFPLPGWAAAVVEAYKDPSVIGVTGPSIPLWEDPKLNWVPEEFYWIVGGSGYSEWTEKREVRNVSGTNMSFRKEAFTQAGVFLTNLGAKGGGSSGKHELVGDETELSIRVVQKTGKRILFIPEMKVRHRVYKFRVTPGFVARRAYWEGYTKALFSNSYRKTIKTKAALTVERQLLNRIVFRLVPDIATGFFKKPGIARRKLSMTVTAVFFVGVGYLSYTFWRIVGRDQTRV
ncbi:MAG: glycosyltransferase [Dehalococcoidales bacterium]|nr:glycosyltransferase [Dehalococcoidales bacterium]